MLGVGGGGGSRAVGKLRRKSWQLITLNRFFQKGGERQQLSLDTEANKQLAHDVKAELQLLMEEARNNGRFSTGFASHTFQNGDKYDGEWKDGTMNGKGVFKFKNGNEYAGFWAENKRQGQGAFTNAQTGTKYEGQWQTDKRHGRGKFTDREGNCFEGTWKNNEMSGQGIYRFINGDLFDGQFERNDFNGRGKFKYGNGDYYEGDWRDGKCHGHGVFTYPAIDHRYEGQWANDKKHGRGKYTAPDYIYEGEWRDDAMSGMGTYSYPNGDRYVGEWLDNEEHGQGCFYHADGSKFDGYFAHGKRAGWGVFTSMDGSRYEGNWKDNVKSGQGAYTYPNGDKYNGGWSNDVMHGSGTYTYKTGKRYKVEYDNGKCVNKQKLEGSFNEAQTARPPAEDYNNYSSAYKQGVQSARGNSLMPATNTGNDWALDKLPVSPSALPNSRPGSAMAPGYAPSPPTTQHHSSTPRNQDNTAKAAEQFLEKARDNIAALLQALEDPAAADPTVADQARDDMQKAMKLKSSPGVPAVTKAELNEVSDQLVELLEMWDDAFTQAQQNALPVETEADKARKERLRQEEEEAKKRERERDDMKKKMEELRQKRKADAEVKLLEAQLEEMKRQRESEERKQQQQEELHKKMLEQAAELERLKREADKAKESANALDILRQQIENEKNRRTGPGAETTDEEKIRIEAERAEAQKLAEIERQRREADRKVKEQMEALRRQMEEEYNAKIDHVKSRLESENEVPTLSSEERKELESQYAREYETQMDDLSHQLKKAESSEDRPLAADEVAMELDRLKRLYEKEQVERKKIYNELVDMKGSIRVYVRVRPMSEKERQTRGGVEAVEFPTDASVIILGDDGKKAKDFTFDRVFPMTTTQIQVFADTLPVITSVVDGYNVCIFAYGQTGSGKTWTMNGIPENPGVMRRSITELFRIIQDRSGTEECEVNAAVLEVYNEEIRDLLIPRNAQKKYSVKTDPVAGQYVDNLTYRPVRVPNDIEYCMSQAEAHRTANATNMNAHSSRSHMLLYIVLSITNKQTHSKIVSKLSLIDLAGSERIAKSGVTGQALKEAQHINKSLSALGDVIASLKNKGGHIPYRNSILTHLLQDSLGGRAKTLMFANISPLSGDFSETISTLEFAGRTRGIQLGRAKKNISAT